MVTGIPPHAVVVLGDDDDLACLPCGHFCLARPATGRCCACAASRSACQLCRPTPRPR
jgi:hypothetical protein